MIPNAPEGNATGAGNAAGARSASLLPDVPPTLRLVGDDSGWTVIVDWRDGSPADAHAALQAALRDCGIDPCCVSSEDIRTSYSSYRGDAPELGYFRVTLRKSVLSTD